MPFNILSALRNVSATGKKSVTSAFGGASYLASVGNAVDVENVIGLGD